jgi:hypothetical protein
MVKTKAGRGTKFTMLLSKSESLQLRELAKKDGVPASTFLRSLIRRLHEELRNPVRRTLTRTYDALPEK